MKDLFVLPLILLQAFGVPADELAKEDASYWNRLLSGQGYHKSMPTQQLVPSYCAVNVDLECRSFSSKELCASIQRRTSNCIETIVYEIDLRYFASGGSEISKVDFTFNGRLSDFSKTLDVVNLLPDQSTRLSPRLDIDVCNDSTFEADIYFEAKTSSGSLCSDKEDYFFTLPVLRPTKEPTASPMFSPEPTPRPTLEPLCIFSLDLNCRLADGQDCTAIAPSADDCIETLFYEIEFCNLGFVPILFDVADITINGQTNSILLSLPLNPLPPGQCFTPAVRFDVDACASIELIAEVSMEGRPVDGGLACQDDYQHILILFVDFFPTPPPSDPPTCDNSDLLYSNSFESPNQTPVRTTYGILDGTPVNTLYGRPGNQFSQQFTVETFFIRDSTYPPDREIFQDPMGIAGEYAIGMQGTLPVGRAADDLLALGFDLAGRRFVEITLDLSAISVQSTVSGLLWPLADVTLRLSLLDDPTGSVPVAGAPVLDFAEVTSPQGPNPWTFNFVRQNVVLDASAATNGIISIVWDIVDGGYAVFDNLVILAQDCGAN